MHSLLLHLGSAPRLTERTACKVRLRFTLILVCAIRQNEEAPAPEASPRSGQAAAGRGSSSTGLSAARRHRAMLVWAGML